VSRLFPEPITVRLAPDQVTVGARAIDCDPRYGAEPWQGAIAALRGVQWDKRSRVAAVLSNHFVRYALVPWSRSLANAAEEEAYVRHHFARIHGERAKAWSLRWSEDGADAPRLASAIDAGLLAALKAAFPARGKARLVSIQPALMALANRARRALPAGGAWIVAAERDRACVGLYSGRRWQAVQNAKGPWLPTLEREWHRVEPGAPRVALLAGASAQAAEGWTVREVPA
jgi:hypothetical protein